MFVQLTVLGTIIIIIIMIIIIIINDCCSAPAVCGGPPGGVHSERVGGAAPVHAGTLLKPQPGHHLVNRALNEPSRRFHNYGEGTVLHTVLMDS